MSAELESMKAEFEAGVIHNRSKCEIIIEDTRAYDLRKMKKDKTLQIIQSEGDTDCIGEVIETSFQKKEASLRS